MKNIAKNNLGFTLVELLVGLVLSLFIIGVALTYFISSSQTFKSHTAESVIQENSRFALEFLTQNFRLAGMNPSDDFTVSLNTIYNAAKCGAGESGISDGASGSERCTREGDSSTNNSDRVAIDYALHAESTAIVANGCNGSDLNVPANSTLRVASTLWTADIDGDGVRSLYCQTINIDTGVAAGPAAPIVDGVDRMQVQYGIDNNDDGVIERYQSFTNLGASNIDKVKAIRLALLISSGLGIESDAVTEEEIDRQFVLLDAPAETFNDWRLRNIFTTTVALPNTLL